MDNSTTTFYKTYISYAKEDKKISPFVTWLQKLPLRETTPISWHTPKKSSMYNLRFDVKRYII